MTTRVDIGLDPRRPLFQGDSFALACTITTDDEGTPQDLTGATVTYAVFDLDPETGAPIVTEQFQKTVGSGIALTNPTAGLMTITVLGSNTQALTRDFYHECEITIGSATHTSFFGTIRFRIDGVT